MKFQVDCVDEFVYRALIKLAKKRGWSGSALDVKQNFRWLVICHGIDSDNTRLTACPIVSIEGAVRQLRRGPPKPKPERMEAMKKIVIAIDQSGNKALYIAGELYPFGGDTFHATELVEAAGDEPVTLRQVEVEDVTAKHWPNDLADLKPV